MTYISYIYGIMVSGNVQYTDVYSKPGKLWLKKKKAITQSVLQHNAEWPTFTFANT